jgi:hypothetical protein
VGAQEQGPYVVSKDAFDGDPVISFMEVAQCTIVKDYYLVTYGISFSDNFYREGPLGAVMFASAEPGSNFNGCTFYNDLGTEAQPITVTFDKRVTGVGFIGFSPYGGITVTPFRDEDATATVFFDTYDTFYSKNPPFIGIEDPLGIDMIKIEGDGSFGRPFIFWIDDFTFGVTIDTGPTEIEVTMNVNPPSCSGTSINMKSKGVTPVVIAGSEDFDMTMIDTASIQLHGVAPVRSAIEDVTYCNNSGSYGYWDLTLKFDTKDLVDAMEASALAEGLTLENDDLPVLHLTGSLLDGTTLYADEPVSVKGKPGKENRGRGVMHPLRHNRGHHKGWDKHR